LRNPHVVTITRDVGRVCLLSAWLYSPTGKVYTCASFGAYFSCTW